MRYRSVVPALMLVSWSLCAEAQPQPTPEIEVQHQQGLRLREQHMDEEARVIFVQLWERTHEARALARMALAEQALRRSAAAEGHMMQALAMEDPWIHENRSVLEGVLQQIRVSLGLSVLVVTSNVASAEVFLNGSRVGAVATPLRMSPGRVSFEVRAQGFVTGMGSVTLTLGTTAHETVDLVATRAPVVTQARTPEIPRNNTVLLEQERPKAMRTMAWVSAAGAVVFAGLGVTGYVAALSAASRWNSEGCTPPGMTREQTCSADRDTAMTMNALGVAGLLGGGALAATSALLFVLSGSSHREQGGPSRAALSCGSGPGELGIACAGQF